MKNWDRHAKAPAAPGRASFAVEDGPLWRSSAKTERLGHALRVAGTPKMLMIDGMSVEEELKEHAEHAQNPFDKRVAATMAMIAAALAVVSVFGHLMTTEELLNQQKASDQWSYYQAKSIRRYVSEVARDAFAVMKDTKDSEAYAKNAEKYKKDDEEIQKEARALENESHKHGQEALRLHFGEVFLEMSIVFASLAILSKRAILWYGSIVVGLVGVGIAASTFLLQ